MIGLIACLYGCDILDKNDKEHVIDELVWEDENLATAYVNALYDYLPGWEVSYANASDEASGSTAWTDGTMTPDKSFTQLYDPVSYWPYNRVRDCNTFIKNIADRSITTIDIDLANRLLHEVRFIRAYIYFEMVKRFGGVPLITEPQDIDDNLFVKRASTLDCFQFIFTELEACVNNLPDSYDANDLGRVTKAAAKSLLGRIWLFRASKQFNPTEKIAIWETAYQQNKEAYEYALSVGHKLYSDYENLFLDEMNDEVILASRYVYPTRGSNRDAACRPIRFSQGSSGGCHPIQETIDRYPTADGKLFTISDLGPNDNIFRLWDNRDARFYASVVYQGITYFGEVMELHENADNDYAYSKNIGSLTGYYTKKGIDQSLSIMEAQTSGTDFIDIRLGEVMLNYAETAVETGNLQEAFEMLAQIRERAGIVETVEGDAILNGKRYGLDPNMSQDEMRQAVRDERFIELLFEQKRLWDLRRWWIHHEVMVGSNKRHALVMTKQENGSYTWYLQDRDTEKSPMFNSENMYFLPIRRSELTNNPNLEQTKGWENGTFDPQEGL